MSKMLPVLFIINYSMCHMFKLMIWPESDWHKYKMNQICSCLNSHTTVEISHAAFICKIIYATRYFDQHCADLTASSSSSSSGSVFKCFAHKETIKACESAQSTGVDDCVFMCVHKDRWDYSVYLVNICSTHSVSSEVGYSFSQDEYLTFNSSLLVLPLKFGGNNRRPSAKRL